MTKSKSSTRRRVSSCAPIRNCQSSAPWKWPPLPCSGRDLFSRGKIGAAFRAGKHLVRIAAVLRIEHPAQRAHRVQVVLRELLLHEINLLHSDSVFPRHATAQFDA